MKSSFFYGEHCRQIAQRIQTSINAAPDFLSSHTAQSPRAAGDAIELLVAENFAAAAGEWCEEYSSSFARRAMADLAFRDKEGFYCIVDVKTHRQGTAFSMPALVSAERLARFYEDDENIFSLLMVKYIMEQNSVQATEVIFLPIEFLSWDCLTVGALGWGQIQIANSNHIVVSHGQSRKEWMLSLCEAMLSFYPKEILKIQGRIKKFNSVRDFWQNKTDFWR